MSEEIFFPKDLKDALKGRPEKGNKQNVAFLPIIFIPFAFPYVSIKEPLYKRSNVKYQLVISTMNGYPLPYGSLPRLILAYLVTEAVRTKSRTVFLGSSMTEFLKKLGMRESGGKYGSATYLKRQLYSVIGCTIYCESVEEKEDHEHIRTLGMTVVDASDSFWGIGAKKGTFQSKITLSEQFYSLAVNSPVPISWDIIMKLKKSALAVDVYCWATYRVKNVNGVTRIAWDSLASQFGFNPTNASLRKFKFKFRKCLAKIKNLYPNLRFDDSDSQYFILYPSKTSITKKLNKLKKD